MFRRPSGSGRAPLADTKSHAGQSDDGAAADRPGHGQQQPKRSHGSNAREGQTHAGQFNGGTIRFHPGKVHRQAVRYADVRRRSGPAERPGAGHHQRRPRSAAAGVGRGGGSVLRAAVVGIWRNRPSPRCPPRDGFYAAHRRLPHPEHDGTRAEQTDKPPRTGGHVRPQYGAPSVRPARSTRVHEAASAIWL
uniref:(northern house mosquito) hypothetical protein n=1 Tax=Culex pipiens TaxID=7175 RepID=A0A8D8BMG3_CULPI